MGGGIAVVLSLLALSVATLSTNLAANVVSTANAVVNLAPRRFSFRLGSLLAAGLGVVILPWKLIESSSGFIFTWLVGYSALLGPIGGILLTDYFVLRRTVLDREGLYRRDGPYWYRGGTNWRAIAALLVGVAPNVPGFLHTAGMVDDVAPLLAQVYTYSWFVGFLLAAVLYWILMRWWPPTPVAVDEA
jgi:NCS1 family nucleobase:cation symporter-1